MFNVTNSNFDIIDSSESTSSPTYMKQLCSSIKPKGLSCEYWFRRAVDHCADLMFQNYTGFLSSLRKFFTKPLSIKPPVSPTNLNLQQCNALYVNIAYDYMKRVPIYMAHLSTNTLLWRILLVMLVLALLYAAKHGWFYYKADVKKKIRMTAPNKSLKQRKGEVFVLKECKNNERLPSSKYRQSGILGKYTTVNRIPKLELRVGPKAAFMEAIGDRNVQFPGTLHRATDLIGQKPIFSKPENIANGLKYFNYFSNKLEVTVKFDEDELPPPFDPVPEIKVTEIPRKTYFNTKPVKVDVIKSISSNDTIKYSKKGSYQSSKTGNKKSEEGTRKAKPGLKRDNSHFQNVSQNFNRSQTFIRCKGLLPSSNCPTILSKTHPCPGILKQTITPNTQTRIPRRPGNITFQKRCL